MTIFLIDDDVDDRQIFLSALNTIDSSIMLVTASNGIDALEKINVEPKGSSVGPANELFTPDYIFLDLNMPYMSGKKCLGQLREIERLKNVPIIIYSTIKKDYDDLGSGLASGFVTKPKSMEEIIKVLSGIIKDKKYFS